MATLGLHPNGAASKARSANLNIAFGPEDPDYSQIAVAAGGAWGRRVTKPSEVEAAIKEGVKVVLEEKRCAVIDVVTESL